MKHHNIGRVITKDVLTSGGRIMRKQFVIGNGISEVRFTKDHVGRKRMTHVGRNRTAVHRSAPRISSRDVMDSIGNSLGGMNIRSLGRGVRRGRGITLL